MVEAGRFHLPSNTHCKILSMQYPCTRGIIEVQSVPQMPHNAFHSHPMRWTDFEHELAHCTHRKCNIGHCGHHCIYERSYPKLVKNAFHLFLHIPNFLIRKF